MNKKIKIVSFVFCVIFTLGFIAVLCWAMGNSGAYCGKNIDMINAGCKLAVSSISSEQGRIVSIVNAETDDSGLQTVKTEYDIKRRGQRLLLSSISSVLDVKMPPDGDSDYYVKPDVVMRKQLSFDGQSAVSFMPHSKEARISAWDSNDGSSVVNEFEDEIGLPNYGTVDIGNLDRHIIHGEGYVSEGPKIIGSENIDGNECIVVEMKWTNNSHSDTLTETWRFWVDPSRGYTVPKIKKYKQGGVYSEKTLVAEIDTDLRQYGDVWGPSRVVHNSYRIDKDTGEPYLKLSKTMTYSADYCMNTKVTDSELKLDLPSGTKVNDDIRDTHYVVP